MLSIGTNTLSIKIADGTIISTFDVIVEETYRKTSTRSFLYFEDGYSKSEINVNTPVVNNVITGTLDSNNNYSYKIDKFISKIQNS